MRASVLCAGAASAQPAPAAPVYAPPVYVAPAKSVPVAPVYAAPVQSAPAALVYVPPVYSAPPAPVPTAPVPAASAYAGDALEGLKRKAAVVVGRLAENIRYVLVALMQLLALLFMDARLGTLSLEYAGEDAVGRWIMNALDVNMALTLFGDMGLVRVLVILVGIVAAVLILKPFFTGDELKRQPLALAAAVSALEMFWFVAVMVFARVKALNGAREVLDGYLDGWSVTDIVRVDISLTGKGWLCMIVFLLSAVVAVRTCRAFCREQEKEEARVQAEKYEDYFSGTDTSYAEKLRRESRNTGIRPGARRVCCPNCGHTQPEGVGLCANCYEPVVLLGSRAAH